MSINKKILFSILMTLTVFIFITEIFSYTSSLNKIKEELYVNNKAIYTNIIQLQSQSIKTLSLVLANDSVIKEAYVYDDGQSIKEHLAVFWAKVKKEKLIHEIHFFKPPAISFVNFSAFSSKGRDVSHIRKDIKWVTSTKNSSSHTMVCNTYAGIRATFPIISDDGKVLGGLSMGKKIDWLPETIKETTKLDSFLVYNKNSTDNLIKEYYTEFIKDKKVISEYILANQTIKIDPSKINDIDFDKDIQNFIINGKTYSLNLFKIFDFEKKTMGYICILNDLKKFNTEFITQMIINLFLLLTGSAIIYFILRPKMEKTSLKIKEMEYITQEIKKNNFKVLDEFKDIKLFDDELSKLELNIITMGKELHSSYNQLEVRVKEEVQKNAHKDQQMLQQSRLAQMGEMISMIAHQWRQPLTAISATTNNLSFKLMMDDIDKKEFEKEINLISDYSQHLSKTIDDFRGFFKVKKNKELTTLSKVVNETLDIIKISIENKNIKITTNLECQVEFETYPSEVKQVILNLIKNAEDILLEKNIKNPMINITTICKKDNIYSLVVKDNGGGIPEDIINQIFDPYFSTKKEKDGTGLGLYMSKRIIEEHCNGKINVFNDNDGAVFEIFFNQNKEKE